MRIVTEDQVLAALKAKQGNMTLREFAKKIGVSAAYISDIYRRNREPGKKILAFLGFGKESSRHTTYFELNGAKR